MSKKVTIKETLEKLDNLPKPEAMSEQDKKFYSGIGSALFSSELQQFIQNKQWILGTIIMGSILDFVGKTKLIWYHNGKISTKKILKYKFVKTIEQLQKNNIIDVPTYEKLEEIRKIRNSFAHDLVRQWGKSFHPNPEYEKLIRDGTKIIESLLAV